VAFFTKDPIGVVEQALKQRGWKYHKPDPLAILTGVKSRRSHLILVRHDAERKTLLFLFAPTDRNDAPLHVHSSRGHSQEQIGGVSEILAHRNFTMLLGSFERDATDGELRYRIAIPYRDTNLSTQQAQWCIDIGIGSLDRMIPKIEDFLSGKLSLEEALELGEGRGPMEV